MRFCPQCHLILEAVDWNGSQIHACRSCGGCWLPEAAFVAIVRADSAKLEELDSLFPGIASTGMFEGLPKACPDCRTAMLERTPLEGVECAQPSSCPQCGGKWLEAGETGLRKRRQIAELQIPIQPEPAEAGSPAEPAVEESVGTVFSNASTTPATPILLVEPAIQPITLDPPVESPIVAAPQSPASFRSAETMPDPRPRSKRKTPLGADADSDDGDHPAPPLYQAQRWCPQCRRGFSANHVICTDCTVGLVESSYRIRCLRCSSENTISADRCWKCHAPLHSGGQPNTPPIAPFATDEQLIRQQAVNLRQVSKTTSCGTAIFLLIIAMTGLIAFIH